MNPRLRSLLLSTILFAAMPSNAAQTTLTTEGTNAESEVQAFSQDRLEASLDTLYRIRNEHGADSIAYGRQMVEVGKHYIADKSWQQAIEAFEVAVRLISESEGIFSEELIEPLSYIGFAEYNRARFAKSTDAMSRAQHITHRLEGMLNTTQLPFIYYKALNLLRSRDIWESIQVQRSAYKINRSEYGITNHETIKSARQLGSWLTLVGEYRPALSIYRNHLRAIEDVDGPESPLLIPLLEGQAVTYFYSFVSFGGMVISEKDRGFTSLARIIEIQDKHPQQFSRADRYTRRIELADILMGQHYEKRALRYYEAAWEMASPEQMASLSRDFHVLGGPFVHVDPDVVPEGDDIYYDFEFSIKRDGRPQYIKLINTNATGSFKYNATGAFRGSRFRPRIDEGNFVSVASNRQRFLLQFSDPARKGLLLPVAEQAKSMLIEEPGETQDSLIQ